MRNRITRARIDDVREVLSTGLKEATVVARRCDRLVRECNSGRHDAGPAGWIVRAWLLDSDSPGPAPRVHTMRAQLARQVDEVVSDADRIEVLGGAVDATAL